MFVRPSVGFSKPRAEQAVDRAVACARRAGFEAESGAIISEGANVLVRLTPQPILARVSHLVDLLRVEGAWQWFVREIEITRWLTDQALRGPRPLEGPFRDGEVTISFWEWLDHDPYPHPADRDLGAALAALHRTLGAYNGELPDLRDVVVEVDELSERVDDDAVAAAFRRKLALLTPALDRIDRARMRALHGDAHQANVVGVDGEIVWLDFEDACRGPVEYDLACMLAPTRALGVHDEREVLEGYGDPYDPELLELMVEARLLQNATWSAVVLTEIPDLARAEARVAWWLANCSD